jgi:hypothetical protein
MSLRLEPSDNFGKSMTTDCVAPRLFGKSSVRLLLLLAVVGVSAGASEAQQRDSPFVGTWVGTIAIDQVFPTPAANRSVKRQIRISRDGKVRVYLEQKPLFQKSGKWQIVYGQFVLTELGDDAVITLQRGSEFRVDSQTINLTKVDQDRMLVYWWVVGEDLSALPGKSSPVLAFGGHSEFQRPQRR